MNISVRPQLYGPGLRFGLLYAAAALISAIGCASPRSDDGSAPEDDVDNPGGDDTGRVVFPGQDTVEPPDAGDPGDVADPADLLVGDAAEDDTGATELPDAVNLPDLTDTTEESPTDLGSISDGVQPPECTSNATCGIKKVCAAGACVDECDPKAAAATGLGCHYLAVDLPNSTDPASAGGVSADELPSSLTLSNPWGNTSVTVKVLSVVGAGPISGGQLTLLPGGTQTVLLPNRPLAGTTKVKAAFSVESDRPIMAMMMSPHASAGSTSATRLLPISSSGLAHVAITGPTRAFFTVAAAENDTVVTIRPTGDTVQGSGIKAMSADGTYVVTLKASEVLHVQAAQGVSLTGTRVDSTKPVAMFAGSVTTTWGTRCCGDMVAEQMPPVSAYGTVTIVSPGPARGFARDSVHVVAVEDGTVVEIESTEPLKVTLNAGDSVRADLQGATKVTSSRPVLVAMQLAAAHARTAQGDVCTTTTDCPANQLCFGPPSTPSGICIAACEPAQDDCPSAAHRCLDRFGTFADITEPGICSRRPCDAVSGACPGDAICDPTSRCRQSCTVASVCDDPSETCGLFGVALMCGAIGCDGATDETPICAEGTTCLLTSDGNSSCTSGCNPTPKCATPGYRCLADTLYVPGSAPFTGEYCVAPTCSVDQETGAAVGCPKGFDCVNATCVPRGDPALTIVPSVSRFLPWIPLVVPDWAGDRRLMVVAPEDAFMQIDGVPMSESDMKLGPLGWKTAIVPVTAGTHFLTSDVPVAVSLMGFGPEVGWATSANTPLGLQSEPTIPPPEDTSDTVGPEDTSPDSDAPDSTPLEPDVGPTPPTWNLDVAPLLAVRCAPCHTGGSKLGGLSVNTYAATQIPSVACPGANMATAIALKSAPNSGCGGTVMPPAGPPLTADELAMLEAWVAAGQPE